MSKYLSKEGLEAYHSKIMTELAKVSSLPAGGEAGDILVKQSSTDGDVAWQVLVEVGATGQTLPSGKLAIGGIFFMEVD